METGKVKWYNEVKGYGFILTDNGQEIFVHRSKLSSPFAGLEEGQKVEFEVQDGEKGPIAVNVKTV